MAINQIKPNLFQLHFKEFGSCVYILKINNQNIVIDTSSQEARQELSEDLEKLKIKPNSIDIIILTHNHQDHNANINLFPNAVLYTEKNIESLPIKEFKIYKAPGHSKDSIALLYQDILFSGDTLFHNGIGRTDLPESEPEKMQKSLNTLKNLPYKTLCPGHIS